MNEHVRAKHAAIIGYLTSDMALSVHQISKLLVQDFGSPLMPTEIATVRSGFFRSFKPDVIPSKVVAVTVKAAPKCTRCAGPHWVSECTQPLPEPIQLTHPAAPEEAMNSTPFAISDSSAAVDARGAQVEMLATAPHPDSRRRTTAGMMMRRQWANDMIDREPGIDPMVLLGRVKEHFGVGLDWRYIYETCRIAREIHQLPQIPEHDAEHERSDNGRNPLPEFNGNAIDGGYADNPDDECLWLAQQANDIMRAHKLTELRLTVDGGKAKWIYKVVTTGEGEVSL